MSTPRMIAGAGMASNSHARSIKTTARALQLALLLTICLAAAQSQAQVCRVTTAGTDTGDGSDWNAQAMDLDTALAHILCDQIWVAGGVYTPSDNSDFPNAQDSFVLVREAEIYGGFDGTETDLGERDPAVNPTVLSGDVDDNDVTNDDGVTETADDIEGNNSWKLFIIDGTTASGPITAATVLDGLIFTAGEAINNTPALPGATSGALFCDGRGSGNECSPTLNNVTFSGNFALREGGAMYSVGDGGGVSNPALSNVTFSGNRSLGNGGGFFHNGVGSPTLNNVTFSGNSAAVGGGMASFGTGSPTLVNVTFNGNSAGLGGAMFVTDLSGTISATLNNVSFIDNSAGNLGGAMHISHGSSPVLNDVAFSGNSSDDNGGAMYIAASSPVLNRAVFNDNSAVNQGGAIYTEALGSGAVSTPTLNNVTFSGNGADFGGAMYNLVIAVGTNIPNLNHATFSGNSAGTAGGAMYNNVSAGTNMPVLNNAILWGNNAPNGPEIVNQAATPEINDSIVQGGCPTGSTCDNVIDADPLLGPLADNGGLTQTMRPGASGAAVDAGNNATCLSEDQRDIARPQGDDCDIGAVELAFPAVDVEVDGLVVVFAAANPSPVSGEIAGCDAAGQGQSHCMATYTEGDMVALNLAPSANWHVESATGCDGVLDGNSYTTAPVLTNCTVNIVAAIDQYTVIPAVTSGMGTISPDTAQTVDHGEVIEFTLAPETGWSIDSVSGTCPGTLAGDTYVAGPITADCAVEAAFVQDPVDGQCGAADGGVFTEPPTKNLCAAGQPSEVLGDGPWTWTCQGIAGGEDAQCGADFQPPENDIFDDRFEEEHALDGGSSGPLSLYLMGNMPAARQ